MRLRRGTGTGARDVRDSADSDEAFGCKSHMALRCMKLAGPACGRPLGSLLFSRYTVRKRMTTTATMARGRAGRHAVFAWRKLAPLPHSL